MCLCRKRRKGVALRHGLKIHLRRVVVARAVRRWRPARIGAGPGALMCCAFACRRVLLGNLPAFTILRRRLRLWVGACGNVARCELMLLGLITGWVRVHLHEEFGCLEFFVDREAKPSWSAPRRIRSTLFTEQRNLSGRPLAIDFGGSDCRLSATRSRCLSWRPRTRGRWHQCCTTSGPLLWRRCESNLSSPIMNLGMRENTYHDRTLD